MIHRLKVCLAQALLFIPFYSIADDIPPSSSATLSVGTDSDQNQSKQIHLNFELDQYQQFSAGYGDSTSNSSLLNTSQFFIGAATSPYESFSMGAEYSKWGKNNGLEIRNLQTDLFVNFEQWGFSLSPQISVVTFYGNGVGVIGSGKYDLYSQGIAISSTYYGIDNYFIGINYFRNQFADDPFFLRTQTLKDFALSRISESAQLLMSGLEKHHESLSLGRFFQWGSLEIDWTQSKAALVEDTNNTYSLIIDYEISKQLGASLFTSRQISNHANNAIYSVDLGITINW